MNNEHLMPVLQEHYGYYYEKDEYSGEFSTPKMFDFNTYDDSQYREYSSQNQSGIKITNTSISIETTDNLPFKSGDKIFIPRYKTTYSLSELELRENEYASLVTLLFPWDKSTAIKRLHLNKGR
jgi:hypothetical protein